MKAWKYATWMKWNYGMYVPISPAGSWNDTGGDVISFSAELRLAVQLFLRQFVQKHLILVPVMRRCCPLLAKVSSAACTVTVMTCRGIWGEFTFFYIWISLILDTLDKTKLQGFTDFSFFPLTVFVVNFAPPTSVLGSPTSRSQIGLCRSFAAGLESLCYCVGIINVWYAAEALLVKLLCSGVAFGKKRRGRRSLLQLSFSSDSRFRWLELPDVVRVGGVDSICWSYSSEQNSKRQ